MTTSTKKPRQKGPQKGARPAVSRRKPPPRRSKFVDPKKRNRTPLFIVLGTAVLVIVAIAMTRNTTTTASGVEETRPVTVTGDALPAFEEGPDQAIGAKTPEISGSSFDGDPLTIPADGAPKVVIFLAHWCPHCQVEVPMITENLPNVELPDDVDLLSVSTAVDKGQPNYPPSRWLSDEGWPLPVIADDAAGTAGAAYGVTSYPYFVFADAKGRVVERYAGEMPFEDFAERVRSLVE